MRSKAIGIMLAGAMVLGVAGVASAEVAPSARYFANCDALNKVYKHGVGRPNAVDKTSGQKVRNFKKSRRLYNANDHLDRDNDKIACEQR